MKPQSVQTSRSRSSPSGTRFVTGPFSSDRSAVIALVHPTCSQDYAETVAERTKESAALGKAAHEI